MSTTQVPKSEVVNPSKGRLFTLLSALIAIAGIYLAFLPLGFGFVTVFVAVPGVILGAKATHNGMPRAGSWASRANMLPVIFYVAYMVSFMPEEATTHTISATVTEAGVLADQSVFDKKGAVSGHFVDKCKRSLQGHTDQRSVY